MNRRRRVLGILAIGAALFPASPAASSDDVSSPDDAPSLPFWDRYVAARELLGRDADACRAHAARLAAADPDDFLGSWLRGALARESGDSAAAAALLAEAEAPAAPAGARVAAGTLHLLRGEREAGRVRLERARDVYAARRRPLDACRASLWKVVLAGDDRGDAESARDVAEAESLGRRAGDAATLADVLLVKGRIAYGKDFQAALAIRREALALLEPFGPSYQLMECLRGIGNALNKREEYDEAAVRFLAARKIARDLGHADAEGDCLIGLGNTRKGQGRFREALDHYARAAALGEESGDRITTSTAYGAMGALEKRLGHYRAARAFLEKSDAALGAEGGKEENRVLGLDGLASIDAVFGNYQKARARLEEALRICDRAGLEARAPFVLLHLAQVEADLQDLDGALSSAERGLEIAARAGHRKAELPLLTYKSSILHRLGRPEEALAAAEEAVRLTVETRSSWWYWNAHNGLAQALGGAGRAREGIALLDSLIADFASFPDSLELGPALRRQADLHLAVGEAERAAAAAARAFEVARRLDNRLETMEASLVLGQALVAAGRPAEAIAPLEECLAEVERSRSFLTVSEERSGLVAHWYDGYAALATAHARAGGVEEAFAILERSRARELRELFGVGAPGLSARVPAGLAAALSRVETELSETQAEILHEYSRPLSERSADLVERERRADSLKAVWSTLSERVAREAPALAREAGLSKPMTADEVLRALSPDERLLAYMTGRETTLLFDLGGGRIAAHEIPWGEKEVAERVARFDDALHAADEDSCGVEARSLGEALLGPCRLASGTAPAILFVLPDGALNSLPFEALVVPGAPPEAGARLVEIAEVVYANSATLLLNPPERRAARGRLAHDRTLVAFGDPAVGAPSDLAPAAAAARGSLPTLVPLPHARREVLSLPPLFAKAAVYVGDEATEGRFYEATARAPIVHVAAHAFVDERHPKFSGIVLCPGGAAAATAGDAGEDGIVQAFEIAQRDYDLDLATLSACETGRGRLLRGEGLIGLSRAFRLAGARNLVVSLWKVDDAATEVFMDQFYRRLSGGAAPSTALRGAKLALLRGDAAGAPAHGETARAGARGEADATRGGEEAGAASRGVGVRARSDALERPSAWAGFVLIGSRHRPTPR